MEPLMQDRVEELVNYIMKKCLWQFHSRAWDRKRQNENIITQTAQLLCEEPVSIETQEDRCYWVDAVCLADAFKARFSWLSTLGKEEIQQLMNGLHDRMDHLMITGSLNQELNDQHY
jgi:Fe-only nitrogenase delta subunit